MTLHLPYLAEPKTYYYFRPYNYNHIFMQQEQAMIMGLDPRMPYDNAIFKKVFHNLEHKEEIGN